MTDKLSVIFLPGQICDQRLWSATMANLADIIEPIYISLQTQTTLDEMLASINDCGKERFVLIGFSLGCYIAQEFATKYPEKIIGLGLMGASGTAFTDEEREQRIKSINDAQKFGFKGLNDTAIKRYVHPNNYDNKELTDTLKHMSSDSGLKVLVSQHGVNINRPSKLQDLAKINVPTIVIGAQEDQIAKIEGIKELAASIPNSQLHVIENCGHMIPLEKTAELSAILRTWLGTILAK